MTEPDKWCLTMEVHGISLWINRGDCIDVMFPHDRMKDSDFDHHFVTLHASALPEHRFDGSLLDMGSIIDQTSQTTAAPNVGWLPVVVAASAPAHDRDAARRGTNMVAALRLPAGAVESIDASKHGKFTVSGSTHEIELGYGIRWTLCGNGDIQSEAALISHANGSVSNAKLGIKPTGATNLIIKCLSMRDRTTKVPIDVGDDLAETQVIGWLSNNPTSPLASAPRCTQPPPPGAQFYSYGHTPISTRPDRPCPPGVRLPFV